MKHLNNRRRILIVDDAKPLLLSFERLLTSMADEWDMIFMENPIAALDVALNNPVDVVLSDDHMPEMRGSELVKQIKSVSPETICLLMTGAQDDVERLEVMPEVFRVIQKPFPISELQHIIVEISADHNLDINEETSVMSKNTVCKVMVIDDEELFRNSMGRMLRSINANGKSCMMIEADCGKAALAHLQEEPIDCVLIDNCMPGGNGLDWIERLIEARPTIALVMITGNGDEETAVKAMKLGAIDYLTKGSITNASLERTISNAVEKKGLQNSVESQRKKLMQAERQRVMVESIGAACHHLGQPATALSAYLQLMQAKEKDVDLLGMIDQSLSCMTKITDVLERLRNIDDYRTEPYITYSKSDSENLEERILVI